MTEVIVWLLACGVGGIMIAVGAVMVLDQLDGWLTPPAPVGPIGVEDDADRRNEVQWVSHD